ncbi:MAG: hypothetical protein NC203_04570 [Firmicutes bacterium]|nr:hypothetical protein [[Eubacterium] siraeum]MCM1487625.1 hypothetical protein [Bacillota bacterium]
MNKNRSKNPIDKKNDKIRRGEIVSRGNDSSEFPNKTQEPQYLTYAVTDNETNENGCVLNISDADAVLAKRETDANHK